MSQGAKRKICAKLKTLNTAKPINNNHEGMSDARREVLPVTTALNARQTVGGPPSGVGDAGGLNAAPRLILPNSSTEAGRRTSSLDTGGGMGFLVDFMKRLPRLAVDGASIGRFVTGGVADW